MKIMHNKSVKVIIFICLSCIFLLFIGYRYHKMNAHIPQKFKNEVFTMNEQVSLDNITIEITDFKLTNDKNANIISVNLNIDNVSNNDINIYSLIYHSKILYKNTLVEVPFNVENNEDTLIKYGTKKNITISYMFPYESIDDNIKFYPSKQLYEQEIQNYLENHLLMYEKSIEINFMEDKQWKNY